MNDIRVGYSKLGRSWKLDPMAGKSSAVGGDIDVARALHLLSRARPDIEFSLVGRNSGEAPTQVGYPRNVTNPWQKPIVSELRRFEEIDMAPSESRVEPAKKVASFTHQIFDGLHGNIMWLGQHGTSTHPIPKVKQRTILTQPLRSDILYCYYLTNGFNMWRDLDPSREEILLCPDPRNYLKARDFKWPTRGSVIAQYSQTRPVSHERYGDQTNPLLWDSAWTEHADQAAHQQKVVWVSPLAYTYDALELTAIPTPPAELQVADWDVRAAFGMLVNENRANVTKDRLSIVQDYVMRYWPDAPIVGSWSEPSQVELGRIIKPVAYPEVKKTLQEWKSTLTTPASGSGWATAKPWECFSNGTICFFHPHYDDQDHILADAPTELRAWLRVRNPGELVSRVEAVHNDRATYEYLRDLQYTHLKNVYDNRQGGIRSILERLPR